MIIVKSQDGRKIKEVSQISYSKELTHQASKKLTKEVQYIMNNAYNYGSTKAAERVAEERRQQIYNDKDSIIYCIFGDLIFLGEYKSKERAKEVMEEIEERIRNLYLAKEFKLNTSDFNSGEQKNEYVEELYSVAIYTMPKG